MRKTTSRSGFTLLEMLVASLLMGMLVTILTMVFNSSSIAWRTGKSGVAQLSKVRRQLSLAQYQADKILPRVEAKQQSSKNGYIVSPWRTDEKNGGTALRKRAVRDASGVSLLASGFNFSKLDSSASGGNFNTDPWILTNLEDVKLGSADFYTVGVLSFGPDGKRNTADDISTWPDKVE